MGKQWALSNGVCGLRDYAHVRVNQWPLSSRCLVSSLRTKRFEFSSVTSFCTCLKAPKTEATKVCETARNGLDHGCTFLLQVQLDWEVVCYPRYFCRANFQPRWITEVSTSRAT